MPINASELTVLDNSSVKLKNLLITIREKSQTFFGENSSEGDKLCIVIDYLENLQDEDEDQIRAFF